MYPTHEVSTIDPTEFRVGARVVGHSQFTLKVAGNGCTVRRWSLFPPRYMRAASHGCRWLVCIAGNCRVANEYSSQQQQQQ